MKSKQLLLLIVFFAMQFFAFADDDIRLVGTGKQVVSLGERFRIVYELNADGNNFTAPNFGYHFQGFMTQRYSGNDGYTFSLAPFGWTR